MQKSLILALTLSACAFSAHAAPWPLLEPVTSDVYETPGTVRSITQRGAACMARVLRPGFTNAPTILGTDFDGGTVIANNAYETPGLLGQPVRSRSKATLEAKEGRFRIVFSDTEEFISGMGWQPVRVRNGQGDAPRTLSTLYGIADAIAGCVKAPAADW